MSELPPADLPRPSAPEPGETQAPLRLDGVLERHAFPPLLTAVLAVIVSFLLYQLIGTLALVVLLLQQGIAAQEIAPAMERLFAEQGEWVLVTNAVAQVLGLALPAFFFARLHSARLYTFLRFRTPDVRLFSLSILGLLALTPIVLWLGAFNETLPIPQPEWMRELERTQVELLEVMLQREGGLVLNLLLMAVVPAFCEEILFRGYVQRQAERGLGVAGGLFFSGLVFGIYHFRLSQVIPLSVLGLYLAYVAWRTRSLWPAIGVHFANNALAVWLSPYMEPAAEANVDDVETMGVPWFLLMAGVAFFILILYAMQQAAKARLQGPAGDLR